MKALCGSFTPNSVNGGSPGDRLQVGDRPVPWGKRPLEAAQHVRVLNSPSRASQSGCEPAPRGEAASARGLSSRKKC